MSVDWLAFSPWPALAGGILIGTSAGLLMLLIGRIAGISGILGGLLRPRAGDAAWRLAFLAGMLVAPWVYATVAPLPTIQAEASPVVVITAGLLVGFGTRYGSGCTSGHGVCGLARLSGRSLVATLCFMAAGFATVFITRHWIGS